MTGTQDPLAAHGYSRDKKRGVEQTEYGMLATRAGIPVAVRVAPGKTADPTAFITLATEIKALAKVEDMVMVGDWGMITSARITALNENLPWLGQCVAQHCDSRTCPGPGALQMSLFDEQNLAEMAHPDYPSERLFACYNRYLAALRKHRREELLSVTEERLKTIQKAVATGRLKDAGKTGLRVWKILGHNNIAKHFTLAINDTALPGKHNPETIVGEAELDGIYVIRTSVDTVTADTHEAVRVYKSLANVEKIFKTLKSRDLHIRPTYHQTEPHTCSDVFLCMLAGHLIWHLHEALATLTYTDEARPGGARHCRAPLHHRRTQSQNPKTARRNSYPLLPRPAAPPRHLRTVTRNTMKMADTTRTFELFPPPRPSTTPWC